MIEHGSILLVDSRDFYNVVGLPLTVQYLYDGRQAIGEVRDGKISATLLASLTLDDVIARYGEAGTRTYLSDALGSVIAQSRDDQSVENYYAYTPYGETLALGPDGGNPVRYTGREHDGAGTGLYFYRARYYDPVLKRFLSRSDPIGLRGGLNTYTYVSGNPLSYVDPDGLEQKPKTPNPYSVAGKAICKAITELTDPLYERQQQQADDLYQKNKKAIDGAYEIKVQNCRLNSDPCNFQECMQRANKWWKEQTDANWKWYSNSWQRDKTTTETGMDITKNICEIF